MRSFSIFLSILIFLFTVTKLSAQPARIISDCTIEYDLTIANASADVAKSISGATKTIYIKGSQTRSDLVSPSYVLTIIHDTKSDTTIILKEIGKTKYLSYLSEQKRQQQNKRWEGITFTTSTETKSILGYDCTKVVAKLKDGTTFNVFYTPSIIPSNREYEYEFKDLPGFALEYETQTEDGKNKIKFSANKITLTPVPSSVFDVPKTGYRIL